MNEQLATIMDTFERSVECSCTVRKQATENKR